MAPFRATSGNLLGRVRDPPTAMLLSPQMSGRAQQVQGGGCLHPATLSGGVLTSPTSEDLN